MKTEKELEKEIEEKKLQLEELKANKGKCGECGKTMKLKEEIEFGQCNKCCAWKYREACK